eukprot:m.217610 g.217610  ORF g.217610 m.217610 type:complete len:567 (-) comp15888_c0_seq9:1087-2787(-)
MLSQVGLRLVGRISQPIKCLSTKAVGHDLDEARKRGVEATRRFSIVETTLREGEQFSTCNFTTSDRVYIAKMLDRVGVDYIELVNPAASHQALADCRRISDMALNAKILTHTRCHMDDVEKAVDSGVDGVNIYMATSEKLSKHSHGKGIQQVLVEAEKVIRFVKDKGLEIRFSCEDTFRSDPTDLLTIYKAVDEMGVDRVGLADTVGIATPSQVYETTKLVRGVISDTTGIEFHTHDDTGCATANALMALEGGATHIDACVLGIGERNGITPLGAFLARMYSLDKEYIIERYNLKLLHHLERYVAQLAEIDIPFNNCVTGSASFSHKAGVHSKAVVADPSSYEVLDPSDFGVQRMIQFAHRLTGWNAMQHQAKSLGLDVSDDQIRAATSLIKNLADTEKITPAHVDEVLIKLSTVSIPTSSSEMKKMAMEAPQRLKDSLMETAKAVAEYELQTAKEAVDALEFQGEDPSQFSAALKIKGHLFDNQVLNRIMDIAVDGPCSFKVVEIQVPPINEALSTCVIKLWGVNSDDLDAASASIKVFPLLIFENIISELPNIACAGFRSRLRP